MSRTSTSVLLVEGEQTIGVLDCSEPTAKFSNTFSHKYGDICGMVCVQLGPKKLLITTHAPEKIVAFDLVIKKVEWQVQSHRYYPNQMRPRCITADADGHLFVCDEQNKCIQMFSTSDGQYLGTLMTDLEEGIGDPFNLCWWQGASSLIVHHAKDDKSNDHCFISVLSLTENYGAKPTKKCKKPKYFWSGFSYSSFWNTTCFELFTDFLDFLIWSLVETVKSHVVLKMNEQVVTSALKVGNERFFS